MPDISILDAICMRIKQTGEDAPCEGLLVTIELVPQIKPWVMCTYHFEGHRDDLATEIIEAVK